MVPKTGKVGFSRQSDPTLLILTSLSSGSKHGHALIKDIEEISGVRLGPGTLYGAITRLEEQNLIKPLDPIGRRQPYAITATGIEVLRDTITNLKMIAEVGSRRLGINDKISPVLNTKVKVL
ncbi:MAG: PadR family transcriptional regulator [Acidimicrobiales bacterium]|nr:PadR family transcriptional regulator [Acidimicrobiales bacterium]